MHKYEIEFKFQLGEPTGQKDKTKKLTVYAQTEDAAILIAKSRVPDKMKGFRCTATVIR